MAGYKLLNTMSLHTKDIFGDYALPSAGPVTTTSSVLTLTITPRAGAVVVLGGKRIIPVAGSITATYDASNTEVYLAIKPDGTYMVGNSANAWTTPSNITSAGAMSLLQYTATSSTLSAAYSTSTPPPTITAASVGFGTTACYSWDSGNNLVNIKSAQPAAIIINGTTMETIFVDGIQLNMGGNTWGSSTAAITARCVGAKNGLEIQTATSGNAIVAKVDGNGVMYSPSHILSSTTTPASPVAGQIYYNGTHFYGYNGSSWLQLDN
jgi:hypothetical protein